MNNKNNQKIDKANIKENKDNNNQKQDIKKIDQKQSREKITILRGDLFYADLSPVIGSEQGGVRPVVIIQNHFE